MSDPTKKEEILTKREQLAERFLEFPLLYFVVRSWLMSWRARIAMILGVIMVFGFILGLPRIWRVTPKDFTPEIRISLLDEIKSRALVRNAKKYLAQGRTDYGIMAYNAAIAHNQGNLDRQRTFLELATKRQLEKGTVDMDTINVAGARMAFWIRRISKDSNDTALIARFLEALELDDELIAHLEPELANLGPTEKKMLARAYLRQGYIDRFEATWRTHAAGEEWAKDPVMTLYRAAATAGFGAAEKAPAAKALLEAHLHDGEFKIVANRLYALLCFERRNADDYLATLRRLEGWRQDRLHDHAKAWRLLNATGRKVDALQMADQFNRAPRTAGETSELAAAYAELGMTSDATKLLDQFIERFGFYERLWVQQGLLLASAKDWTALRNLIAKMRLDPGIAHRMEGFSYYLEGRSELGEGRPAAAEELFQRMPEHGVPNMEVAFTMIDQMRALGHLDIAAKLVGQVESLAQDYPRYWMYVVQLASDLRNEDLLLKATEQYYRLQPDQPAARSNFAAALLAARQRPSEAAKVTFEVMTLAPDLPAFQVNHAAALALNSRYAEAEELLETVELARLEDSARTMYYFALTDSLLGQGKFARAEAAMARIDQRFLYPRQADTLKQWQEKISAELKPKSESAAVSK